MIQPEDRERIHPSLRETTIETQDVQLHIVQAGPEDGPLLILLHGFPEFWYGWRHQIGRFAAAGFRVWVPDQRGYNLSGKPKGVSAYHIDKLAMDVVDLMQAAGPTKGFVVGHDWGAAVAWHLATYHPERVEKLGILNVPHPTVMAQTLRRNFHQMRRSWYMFFFQIPWLPEWVLGRKDALGASQLLLRSGKQGTFTDEDLTRYREAWKQPGALTAMINWYRSAIRSGFGTMIGSARPGPQISSPTLMLWGKKDVALSYEMAQPSIDLCEQGQLLYYENATHWLQHDEAEAVNQALVDFLRS